MTRPAWWMWCAHEREWTSLVDTLYCAWCGYPLSTTEDAPPVLPLRRGGARGSRIPHDEIMAAHQRHVDGESIRRIAADSHARWGYRSMASAATALTDAFHHLGLPVRTRGGQPGSPGRLVVSGQTATERTYTVRSAVSETAHSSQNGRLPADPQPDVERQAA